MEAAPNTIRTVPPPERQCYVEQPALERGHLARDIAHVGGLAWGGSRAIDVGGRTIIARKRALGIFRFILHEALSAEPKQQATRTVALPAPLEGTYFEGIHSRHRGGRIHRHARCTASAEGQQVVGVDNFNAYYDP